ncbi:MAG: putative cytochrome c [Massilia sp.]|nr:putative cytochrome c [Massilia sp.]
MRRVSSTVPRGLGALAIALASAVAAAASTDRGLIERGEYLARAGDCVACHTAPGGKPMAGGLLLPTPVGMVAATNITPSKNYGIGNYSLAQFSAALRKGVRADGANLYPAMPYTSYAKVTDGDVQAMYVYFMHAVPAVDAAPAHSTTLHFPFNIRSSMAAWNLLFLDRAPFLADPAKSIEWNRGAYLARGLAHCGACHTPRNVMMAENNSRELAGGDAGAWHAPNITADPNSGVGGWNERELVEYMRLGRAAGKAQAAGPMAEAVDHSLRYLSEEDLRAIAVYVKTVPAVHDAADTRPVHAWGAAHDELGSVRGVAWPNDRNQLSGPQLYDAHCATCHQAQGQGSFDGGLPPLFHNAVLGRINTNNLVMVLLDGIERQADGQQVAMPGFRKTMTDQQIATLGAYLARSYGNPAAGVTVDQVRTLRSGKAPTTLVWMAQGGMLVVLLVALFLLLRKRRAIAV